MPPRLSRSAAAVFLLACLLTGCEGDVGPFGPPGEDGPRGPAGPGPDVVTFAFAADSLEGDGNRRTYTASIDEISEAIASRGTVLAYLEQTEGSGFSVATVAFAAQNAGDGERVSIASAHLPEGGYVAVYASAQREQVIGVSSYLGAGRHVGVGIPLFDVPGVEADTLEAEQTLAAVPHQETSGDEVFNFLTSDGADDGPYTRAGSAVVDTARVTTTGGAAEAGLRGPTGLARTGGAAPISAPASRAWTALPYMLYLDENDDGEADAEVSIGYSYDEGVLVFEFATPDAGAFDAFEGSFSAKVVLVPPEANVGGNLTVKAHDFGTYREAAHALSLPAK